MNTNDKPMALALDDLRNTMSLAADELHRLHARVQELGAAQDEALAAAVPNAVQRAADATVPSDLRAAISSPISAAPAPVAQPACTFPSCGFAGCPTTGCYTAPAPVAQGLKRYEHYCSLDGGGPAEAVEEQGGEWVRFDDVVAMLEGGAALDK